MTTRPVRGPSPARRRAVEALTSAAAAYPHLPPLDLAVGDLSRRDAALARAIWRTALQRWICIEYLLNRHLRQPAAALEPAMRGVLMAGAAALLFLDRQPAHAVVDESVALARMLVRPAAAGMVNAVLRRIGAGIDQRRGETTWSPHAAQLPLERGAILLTDAVLPDPEADWMSHLSVATSHPPLLVRRWLDAYGPEVTLDLCLHGLKTPPVILAIDHRPGGEADPCIEPHELDGFGVWQGEPGTLGDYLRRDADVRVQDPTAAMPLAEMAEDVALVVDYCAGLGTKTHQAIRSYPRARVVAHEVDAVRRTRLDARFGGHDRVVVTATHAAAVAEAAGRADLLILDVPCSNTGVLARRPEARYRYGRKSLKSLIGLQRRIGREAMPLLRPGGHMIYTTCSLDPDENGAQVRWLSETLGLQLVSEATTLPSGCGRSYHDGGYHARLRFEAEPA